MKNTGKSQANKESLDIQPISAASSRLLRKDSHFPRKARRFFITKPKTDSSIGEFDQGKINKDPGVYALKALTDAVNKLKEECRRTGKPLIVWDDKKNKVVEKYYRPLKKK